MKTDLVVVANPRRECYACGSNETTIHRTPRGTAYGAWYGNGIDNQWLCERCDSRHIKNVFWHPITNPRRNKTHRTCNRNRNRNLKRKYGHRARPSSVPGLNNRAGVTENYSPSNMEVVSEFARYTIERR
jgi:hypothetical protein